MKNENRTVPEFQVRTPRHRAGFVPSYYPPDDDVEVWQVWCHRADGEEARRATYGDLETAGFKPKKRKKKKGKGRKNEEKSGQKEAR